MAETPLAFCRDIVMSRMGRPQFHPVFIDPQLGDRRRRTGVGLGPEILPYPVAISRILGRLLNIDGSLHIR